MLSGFVKTTGSGDEVRAKYDRMGMPFFYAFGFGAFQIVTGLCLVTPPLLPYGLLGSYISVGNTGALWASASATPLYGGAPDLEALGLCTALLAGTMLVGHPRNTLFLCLAGLCGGTGFQAVLQRI